MKITELNEELKSALINKDEKIKSYIRSIKSKVDEYLVANRLDREKMPSDDIVISVITAYKKSLEKGVLQLEKGGDKSIDLINEYNDEVKFCGKYLPDASELEAGIEEIVNQAIEELGVSNIKQVGRVIGHIMKNHKDNKLDGSVVKSLVIKKISAMSVEEGE